MESNISLEMSNPCNNEVLNINGQPITLDDILEDTSLYFNPAFLDSSDSGKLYTQVGYLWYEMNAQRIGLQIMFKSFSA